MLVVVWLEVESFPNYFLFLILTIFIFIFIFIFIIIARWTPDSRHIMIVSEFSLRTTVYSLLSGGSYFILFLFLLLLLLLLLFFVVVVINVCSY